MCFFECGSWGVEIDCYKLCENNGILNYVIRNEEIVVVEKEKW